MAWFCSWMIALWNSEQGVGEATDWMAPSGWTGNFWGPEASTRARLAGQLPPLPTNAMMVQWGEWGRKVLRDGDIVFRLGDARYHALLYRTDREGLPIAGPGISEPVRIGDWENLTSYPLTTLAFLYGTGLVFEARSHSSSRFTCRVTSVRACGHSLLETVVGPERKRRPWCCAGEADGPGLRNDLGVVVFVAGELRRSYAELTLGSLSVHRLRSFRVVGASVFR